MSHPSSPDDPRPDRPGPHAGPTTALFDKVHSGDRSAAGELLGMVYDELHQLARRYMDQERNDHTLQPTALVHEAFLKLFHHRDARWESREHFLGMAGQAMRFVLVDHARARAAKKRGGQRTKVLLDEALDLYQERAVDLLALDDALDALAQVDPELARVVELRFFAGMTVTEVARALGVSTRTVERGWCTARAWLRKEVATTVAPPR